jgi:tRNA A-37 threonylcarbamoyl transferase component Bud32/tetratricopeptide (TPR) repeat protein
MTNFDEKQEFKTNQQIVNDGVTLPIAALQASRRAAQPEVHEIGSIIEGRYKILGVIGEGGMGQVYKAQQLATGRLVAVKMLHRNILDETARLRFHQEAKVASAINHPNAAAIYDFGESDSGELYLAMEYVEGENLSTKIKQLGQLPPAEVIDIFLQITDALSDAHEKSIIHRDLKPSNVMLAQTKKRKNLVKILDFGIAKQAKKGEQSLTKTGEVFGTPLYMSPEQCNGEKLTATADIYSIGCMLYEALIGEPPHVGSNFIHTMTLHCQEPTKKFAQVRPDLKIPAQLEAITLKCLNKDPGDRFASMDELHARLIDCAKKNKFLPGSPTGVALFENKTARLAAVGVFMALLAVIAIGWFQYGAQQHSQLMHLIETANVESSAQNYERAFLQAKQTNDLQAVLAIGYPYPRMLIERDKPTEREKAAECLEWLQKAEEKLEPNNIENRLETLKMQAENYGALRLEKQRIDSRLAILKLVNPSDPRYFFALSDAGNAFYAVGDPGQALKTYRAAEEVAKKLPPNPEVDRILALNKSYEGDIYANNEHFKNDKLAIGLLNEAIHRHWEGDDLRWVAGMSAKLAHAYERDGQIENAKKAWLETLSLAPTHAVPYEMADYKYSYEKFMEAHFPSSLGANPSSPAANPSSPAANSSSPAATPSSPAANRENTK